MTDRSPGATSRGTARTRNTSRARISANAGSSSARSSGAFDGPAPAAAAGGGGDHHLYPYRYNPSLRSVGSRVSLSEQFATTRREYEFGFDDAVSSVAQSEHGGDDEEEGDTLTPEGSSFEGMVVVPPLLDGEEEEGKVEEEEGGGGGAEVERQSGERFRGTHYELLCLPEGNAATEEEVRGAYFRLHDILRSRALPARYRQSAERYFGDVQTAFETLIGECSKRDYELTVVDEEDEASSEDDVVDDGDGEDANSTSAGRTDPRVVRRLRRQQEQKSAEVCMQLDSPFLDQSVRRGPWFPRNIPSELSVTHTETTSLPSVNRFLEPKARKIWSALKGPAIEGAQEEDTELYYTPPTVTIAPSLLATNIRRSYIEPSIGLSHSTNVSPDDFPRDRPLEWYSTFVSPLINVKLRQEMFLRQPGLSEAALKKTLPDAVVEVETDALNAASLTARASRTLGPGGGGAAVDDEPVHVEASVSVNRSPLTRNYAARLGLAAHKRLSRCGPTAFACVDSGTSSLWESVSPAYLWDRQKREAGSELSLGTFMKRLSRLLRVGALSHSPPTVEVGCRFGSSADDSLGLHNGRAFTKQARRGLRRLHDDVDLSGPGKGGSWTVSGAFTAGGIAGYLRYGKDLFMLSPASSTLEQEDAPPPARWKKLLNFRMEVELMTHVMKYRPVRRRPRPWAGPDITHVAVRGLKKIGRSSHLGLELGASGADVVLSLYLAHRRNRFTVPVMFLTNHASYYAGLLFWTAFLPALGLAAVDHVLAARRGAPTRSREARAARRRAEAVEVLALLAEPVRRRQGVQRERGGLVVLSAQYGVLRDAASKTWSEPAAPEWSDVADVTVAVAALVDDGGRLDIPEGLRKSRLLGFWDPKPGRTKHLVVRYVYAGREGIKAVIGREGLRLP